MHYLQLPELPCSISFLYITTVLNKRHQKMEKPVSKLFDNLRVGVFLPTFLILMTALLASYFNMEAFLNITKSINGMILKNFSWVFSASSFFMVVLVVIVYLSPIGSVRIGGDTAQPLLSKSKWFMLALSTTTAVGVLFWTTAEPLYHVYDTPAALNITPGTAEAHVFSMATMFLHWTITPYAIYAVPSIVAALVFYNLRHKLSIGSMLIPLIGEKYAKRFGGFIDTLAMFALVAGIASSLGTGSLTLSGGISQYIGGDSNPTRLAMIVFVIVATFVASAASGLHKGLVWLSELNTWIMLALGIFVLLAGPTLYIASLGTESLGVYLQTFFQKSLFTGAASNDPWPHSWTIFYWAVWFAWAPVTAIFLGKVGRGYTVKEFIRISMLYPALFSMVWICIFSGTTIYLDSQSGGALYQVLNNQGIEQVLYAVLHQLPASKFIIAFLLFIAFVAFVTAADSSTDAIGNLCTKNFTSDSDINGNALIKIVWGIIIGIMSWVMVAFVGVDGIKMLSNLGGLPGMLITLATAGSLVYWLMHPEALRIQPKSNHSESKDK